MGSLGAEEKSFFESVRYVHGMVCFLMTERAPGSVPWYGVAFPRREEVGLYGLAVDHWGARSPRLAFAGDYLVGPYTEMALTSGMRAATEVVTTLSK